jgi:malate permease and related proteins
VNDNLRTVLASVVEVFGLIAIAWIYVRRTRVDLSSAMRLGMDIFIPCLSFTAIMDSTIRARDAGLVTAATLIQIGMGLLIGWVGLRLIGWRQRRELLLPIAFVNSANLPFPLLLANFGNEGLSLGVLSYTVTNLAILTIGILILHGGGRARQALREPALWATVLAGILKLGHVSPPEMLMRVPRLAGLAAVPLMLVLFGESLVSTKLTDTRTALTTTILRYVSGAAALAVTLTCLHPDGLTRKVLILYALLPAAMINVVLTQRAGRDATAVASAVLLTTFVGVILLPVLLALLH